MPSIFCVAANAFCRTSSLHCQFDTRNLENNIPGFITYKECHKMKPDVNWLLCSCYILKVSLILTNLFLSNHEHMFFLITPLYIGHNTLHVRYLCHRSSHLTVKTTCTMGEIRSQRSYLWSLYELNDSLCSNL